MVQKKKAKAAKAPAASASVTRIRATDSDSKPVASRRQKKIVPPKTTAAKAPEKEATAPKKRKIKAKSIFKPFTAIGGYFKGAWIELKQVRWPTRRATWSLTGAVLLYTAFFIVLVLMLDAGFKYIFEAILGK